MPLNLLRPNYFSLDAIRFGNASGASPFALSSAVALSLRGPKEPEAPLDSSPPAAPRRGAFFF